MRTKESRFRRIFLALIGCSVLASLSVFLGLSLSIVVQTFRWVVCGEGCPVTVSGTVQLGWIVGSILFFLILVLAFSFKDDIRNIH